jgi:serine/threonine-protein kinase
MTEGPETPTDSTARLSGIEQEPESAPASRPKPAAPAPPGLPEISGYRLLERLGAGGMGEVFLAEDQALGRRVAIKAIASSAGWDEGESRDRLVREARAMASLSHPHLVQVHTLVRQGERDYLVMELVRGGTLQDRILAAGPLPPEEALTLLRQMSAALEAAWARGIIHRDIKPANILLDEHGAAKVADFGLAKPLDGAESLRLTQTGTLIGTPSYMSPEHAGEGEVSFRSDIYSLGLVLYEMLTGRPPFEKMGYLTVVARHIAGDLPDLAEARKMLPERVVALYRWMTRRNPAQRPESYAALREEIDGALAALRAPALGGIASASREPARDGGSRALVWGLALMLLVALGSAGAWWLLHGRVVEKPPPKPVPVGSARPPQPSATPAPVLVPAQRPLPLRERADTATPASMLAALLPPLRTGAFDLRLSVAGPTLEARAAREARFVLFILTSEGDVVRLHPLDVEAGPLFPPGSPLSAKRPEGISGGWAVLLATRRPLEQPIVLGARPEIESTVFPRQVGRRVLTYPAFEYLSWLVDTLRASPEAWDLAVQPL